MILKNTSLSLLVSTAILTSAFAAQAETVDNLNLKNGDRLSGTITSYTSDNVTIDTAFGILNVPVANIGGVVSQNYDMATILGQNSAATLPTDITAAPALSIETPTTIASIAPAAGNANTSTTGLWGAEWSGETGIGLEIETGNSDTQTYELDAAIEGEWANKNRLKLSADYEHEKEDGVKVTDEREAEILHDYFLNNRWFWENRLRLEQDDIDDLNLRANFLSGLGYRAIDDDTTRLQFVLGPGYLHEDFEGVGTTDSLTAHWALEYEQKFYDDLFRLSHNHNLTSPTEDMGITFLNLIAVSHSQFAVDSPSVARLNSIGIMPPPVAKKTTPRTALKLDMNGNQVDMRT